MDHVGIMGDILGRFKMMMMMMMMMMKMMLMTALLREGKVALFFSFGAKHDAFRSSGSLIFHSEVGSGMLMIEDKPFICLHVDSSND